MQSLQFENIITAINRLFSQNQLILIAQKDIGIKDILFSSPLKSIVHSNNEIVELNLRMIEPYLPEILIAFCLHADDRRSVNDLITSLTEDGFLKLSVTSAKLFLQHKMIVFIEALLFADVFNDTWDGRHQTSKLYVHRKGEVLHYYAPYEIRALLKEFLSTMTICSTKTIEDGHLLYKFSLKLD